MFSYEHGHIQQMRYLAKRWGEIYWAEDNPSIIMIWIKWLNVTFLLELSAAFESFFEKVSIEINHGRESFEWGIEWLLQDRILFLARAETKSCLKQFLKAASLMV